MTLQALILAGGQSSRMGSRKELLPHPSGSPMYQYLIEILSRACPELDTVYLSVKNEESVPSSRIYTNQSSGNGISVQFISDHQQLNNRDGRSVLVQQQVFSQLIAPIQTQTGSYLHAISRFSKPGH